MFLVLLHIKPSKCTIVIIITIVHLVVLFVIFIRQCAV
jgi:hypothetical protein